MSGLRTRIAPTPSGFLHAGNALNFLITHQLARGANGAILLRIDDLDTERVRAAYIEDIFESLNWLGIGWDEGPRDADELRRIWSQASRTGDAARYLDVLGSAGHLYACTCSRKELEACSCRDRTVPFDAPGTTWRLRVPGSCIVTFNTWPQGSAQVDLRAAMRDPVLRQRNSAPAYQLMSLCDDVRFGMNLIVRGEDLLPSTACQVYLAGLLGFQSFSGARFLHHPLLMDAKGVKLSKSAGAHSLRSERLRGHSPDALIAQATETLARLSSLRV